MMPLWPRLQREMVSLDSKRPVRRARVGRPQKSAYFGKRRGFIANTNYRLLQGPHPGPSLTSLGDAARFVLDRIGEARP